MDYKNKVLKGFAWEASTKAIVQLMSWVSTIWVARILHPDDYGIVAISGIFTGLCQMLAGLGLSSGVVNRKDISNNEIRSVNYLAIFSGLVLYLLLFFLSGPIATWYELPELQRVIQVAGTVVLISSFAIVPGALIMRELNFRYAALTNMMANFVLIICTLVLAIMGKGYWSLILGTIASQVCIAVAYFAVTRIDLKGWIRMRDILDVFNYSLKMLGSNLTAYINHQIGQIYSSSFLGQTTTGILQMAYTLAGLPLQKIGEIFDKVAFPSISRMKDDPEQAKRIFLLMHRYLFMITCPMFVGLALVADDIVLVLLGEKWLPVILPLQLFCLLNIFRISGQLVPRILAGMGNINASLKFQVITAIALVIALRIGVEYDLLGMLIAWLIAYPCVYVPLLLDTRKTMHVTTREFLASIAPAIIASLVMVVVVGIVASLVDLPPGIMPLALKIGVGAAAYFATYFMVAPNDLKKFLDLIIRRKVITPKDAV